jgi:hypothetical protein
LVHPHRRVADRVMHGPTPDLIKTSVTKTTTPEQYNAASRRYRKELQRNRGRRNSKCTNFWSNATDGYVVSRARANLLVVHGRVRPSVRPRSMDGPWTVLSSAHLWYCTLKRLDRAFVASPFSQLLYRLASPHCFKGDVR